MSKYSIKDILTHAMDIEESGKKFYAALADRLARPELQKIFQIMSSQEIQHYEFYKNLLEQLPASPNEPDASLQDFDKLEHDLLLDRIFNRLTVVSKTAKLQTLGDALTYLIDIEMDVVSFFENFIKLIRPTDQATLRQIINEERAHVRQLVDLRKRYRDEMLR
ncbi:MAG TPA: ferritin family protein [Smithellaceae bacterium]|nr:ferritin family protein [Smithellaceae bacterium]